MIQQTTGAVRRRSWQCAVLGLGIVAGLVGLVHSSALGAKNRSLHARSSWAQKAMSAVRDAAIITTHRARPKTLGLG